MPWQCRWSPTLGELEDTHQKVWGTKEYKNDTDPTVFFGIYGLPDFYALWRHKGRKCILWAGSDILHFRKGYWLDREGDINLGFMGGAKDDTFGFFEKHPIAEWINTYCESYVEDEGEAWQLNDCGIKVKGIIPSFLGKIKDYKVSFNPGNKVYVSANEGRQVEYGWGIVQAVACSVPEVEFHLYGAKWEGQPLKNIILHGKVPKKKMNEEIKNMQCGLRLNKHDGFSEVTAKSVLWGQYPITYLYFPKIDQYTADNCGQPQCIKCMNKLVKLLKKIPKKKKTNIEARNYYLEHLNKYPWNQST